MRRLTWRRLLTLAVFVTGAGALIWALSVEVRTAAVQARLLTRAADGMTFAVEPGANPESRFPHDGPYDRRLGYARAPELIDALVRNDFRVTRQARLSPAMRRFVDAGGFAIYPEKAQAGLSILDRSGVPMYVARHPQRVFEDFQSVPSLIVDTLLFVENRELLDDRYPMRNPAVEWDRFAAAAVNVAAVKMGADTGRFGGSTLATQLEKVRHSPEGRTGGIGDKLRQMATASVRAYIDGEETSDARRRVVVDYLNATPLSARSGFGEVIGLGDGLWAWYGLDIADTARVLTTAADTPETLAALALHYKHVLSLLIAQRRPSYYLLDGRDALDDLCRQHLDLLAKAGIIGPWLRDAAAAQPLTFRDAPPPSADGSFIDLKATNAIRTRLLSLVPARHLYDLDRLDLTVRSTLDADAQNAVVAMLRRLADPDAAAGLGLIGKGLLAPSAAAQVRYSVTVYERGATANAVRVQADNLDRPLDLNEGGKLDLGSTAKLRTLVSYLEVIAELHHRYADRSAAELAQAATDSAADPLTRWVIGHLAGGADRDLGHVLDAAMQRRYSASPDQTFFTGRGQHRFANFDKRHNGQVMTVAEAFRHSVNLVFIRMMRDIVAFHRSEGPAPAEAILADAGHPMRRAYLARFADEEGTVFLDRFIRRYRGHTPDEALDMLAARVASSQNRLSIVFRSVRPDASADDLAQFLKRHLPDAPLSPAAIQRLYAAADPSAFDLNDRGYLARVHPLELWLVGYVQTHADAGRSAILAAGADARQASYAWLFRSSRKHAADSRIRMMLEEDAFARLHRSWVRLGYPFESLVPSYATAIGSSADRPAALAELIGIILNDGVRLPTARITEIGFAEATPYETHLDLDVARGERVLPRALAAVVRRALTDVVENGTARRVAGTYLDAEGQPLAVGGKTGTGDELADQVAVNRAGGYAKEVSRSAAFVFFIGPRFFGVVTAYVPGDQVKRHSFTSALPVQVLKTLMPALQPMLDRPPDSDLPGDQLVATVDGEPVP
jgi:membrane peptidoglycan carboxypeptidase